MMKGQYMIQNTKEQAAQRAADLMANDWHCSEAIFIAVGEHELGDVNDQMIKMTTPFAGGVGGQYKDSCGALTGGLMAIGATQGRTDSRINDDDCLNLATDYHDAFLEQFGSTLCADLKGGDCGELTRQACLILMDLLDKTK
jgi:C_GCAxxG_C_C family probable redox protein